MIDLTERIQAYLRHEYEDQEVVRAGDFRLYFSPEETKPTLNLAVPKIRSVDAGYAMLVPMEAVFSQRGMRPTVQFLDAFNPALAALLAQYDYHLLKEEMVMSCTPESLRPAPEMPGLTTLVLSADSSLEDVQEGLAQTSQLGFDPFTTRLLDTDVELFRWKLVTGRAFVLRLNKNPVTAGMFTDIFDGLVQLAGLTTLEGYRHQGFAAYLTGYMTKYAFARGVDTVFLMTAVDGTEHVYRRVGFKPCATLLTFQKEM